MVFVVPSLTDVVHTYSHVNNNLKESNILCTMQVSRERAHMLLCCVALWALGNMVRQAGHGKEKSSFKIKTVRDSTGERRIFTGFKKI